jgi:hypothetical protein
MDSRLKVIFDHVQINTEYQLIQGTVYTDYDPTWSGVDDISDELEVAQEIIDFTTQALVVFTDVMDTFIDNIKDNIDTNTQANIFIDQMQEILDDPDNGLTDQQREIIQNSIDDKEKVKGAVKQAKEDFASGKNDDYIKENTMSRFASNQSAEVEAETVFNLTEQFESNDNNPDTNTIVYLSPAGIPITLPKEAKPRFLQNNTLRVAKGVLSGFTIGDKVYDGYYAKNIFNGYKLEKGGEPYKFTPITASGNIKVVIGLKTPYLQCDVIFLEGDYSSSSINETGTGQLLIGTQIKFAGESKGLSELSTKYSTCLPKISPASFDKYVLGYYNYFDQGGFLRIVTNNSGGISYIYAISNTEGGAEFFQYNPKSGKWYIFTKPPVDCLSCDLNKMFAALYDPAAIGHFVLDTAGMVPLFGEAFDAVNGVWYLIEGDGTNAIISFASTIPLVYATSAKYIGKIIKLSDGSYAMIKFGSQASKDFLKTIKELDISDDVLKILNKDLANKKFAEAIISNPRLVDSWKKVINQPEWVRKNTDLLSDLVGKSDEFIERVNVFYKNIALPANLPKPLPSSITHAFNGKSIVVNYNKFGLPEFGLHMTRITDNGSNVTKMYKGTWNQVTSSHNAARTKDLKDATNWALETDVAGNLVNFPNGRVRRYTTPSGNPSPTKIEILDDNGNWIEQTWHHHENGRDLIPVPSEIHNPLNHSGGFAAKHGSDGTAVTPDTDVTEIFDYNPIIN